MDRDDPTSEPINGGLDVKPMRSLSEFYDSVIKRNHIWKKFDDFHTFDTGYKNTVEQRIQNMLIHCLETVPYYRYHNQKNSFSPTNLTSFPIVNRQEINMNVDRFLSGNRKGKLILNMTGGSTGNPLHVYQDSEYFDASLATYYLFLEWSGWKPGDKILKIWDSPGIQTRCHSRVRRWFSEKVRKVSLLDAFRDFPETVNDYVDAIHKNRPEIIEAFTNTIFPLSLEIRRRKIAIKHRPKSIIATANPLYPHMEKIISETFQAPVFNRYGSEEAGPIASTCPKGRMHVNPYTHFVEIVDEQGNPIKNGTGRILITLLTNRSMPLVRYDIGDLGTVSENKSECPCGRDWQTLERVSGSSTQLFRKRDGTYKNPGYLSVLIGVEENEGLVKRFQIIQEESYDVTIQIVLYASDRSTEDECQTLLNRIEKKTRHFFGDGTDVRIEICNEIPPLPSGKFPFFVSRLPPVHLGAP